MLGGEESRWSFTREEEKGDWLLKGVKLRADMTA
jgi:hypothetical protein